jgi:hypothetical protein
MADVERTAKVRFEGDSSNYEEAAKKVHSANSKIFESGKRVENNLAGLASDAIRGGLSLDTLAMSVNRLGDVFKTTFGVGVGIAVITTVVLKVAEAFRKAKEEAEKFRKEIQQTTQASNQALRTNDVAGARKALSNLQEQEAKLRDDKLGRQGPETMGESMRDIWRAIKDDVMGTNERVEAIEKLEEQITDNKERQSKLSHMITVDSRDNLEILRAQISGETNKAALMKLQKDRIEALGQLTNIGEEGSEEFRNKEAEFDLLERKLVIEGAIEKLRKDSAFKIADIEDMALDKAVRRYKVTKAIADEAAREAIIQGGPGGNEQKAQEAELKQREAERALREQEEDLNLGKSKHDIRERFREQNKAARELQKHRDELARNNDLIPTKRDMNGNVIEGLNPTTGERETRAAPDPFHDFSPKIKKEMEQGEEAFKRQFMTKKEQEALKDKENAEKQARRDADARAEKDKAAKGSPDAQAITGKLDEVKTAITDKLDDIAIA